MAPLIPQIMMHPEGPQVSQMVFGTWRLCNTNGWEDDQSLATPQSVLERIEACISLGITTFDLADIYGGYRYEKVFGDGLALKPELREKIQLITKTGIKVPSDAWSEKVEVNHYDTTFEHIVSQVEKSLTYLRTSYIDVLLIHRPDFLMDADEVAKAMIHLKDSGKVKYFGVSNHTVSQMELLQSRLPFPLVTNQIEFSPSCLDGMFDGTLDYAQKTRAKPMCWSPLGGGALLGSSSDPKVQRLQKACKAVGDSFSPALPLDLVAYAFLLRHPTKPVIVLGTNKIERLKSVATLFDRNITLSRQQWYSIWEASKGHSVP
ncbi:hypothetical protein BZG36_04837 [Bifiguratus adelaidae]|uniref:NADP-dependent oxidoreductase domain-containing protein n=1 Tax=Bifiguratus adelaidae TaxID=1938954 RepID=A0A261XUL4_9FUNG|nr:hypothetical protein BZG36_04837 [Bifiguratus adelaidae]